VGALQIARDRTNDLIAEEVLSCSAILGAILVS
jgi:hypothetical protein